MTEAEWETYALNPQRMVWALRGTKATRTKAGRRKLRLFACGCCRLIWERLEDPRLRAVLEVAERFAEGGASAVELEAARESIAPLTRGGYRSGDPGAQQRTAAGMVAGAAREKPFEAAFDMTTYPLPLAGYWAVADESALLCDLLRCVFGNPFRPITLDARWRTATVTKMARALYEERNFEDLPILADALEEAGCTNADILGHCRGSAPHVRGCWVVDLLLGKG